MTGPGVCFSTSMSLGQVILGGSLSKTTTQDTEHQCERRRIYDNSRKMLSIVPLTLIETSFSGTKEQTCISALRVQRESRQNYVGTFTHLLSRFPFPVLTFPTRTVYNISAVIENTCYSEFPLL